MSHLLRSHAPIPEEIWEVIDTEARERLVPAMASRKLVDFAGPLGWQYSATNLGRTVIVNGPVAEDELAARRREVLALTELRSNFKLAREELLDADRGAADVDLGTLDEAAAALARAENVAVFHGWGAAGIVGITEASPHTPLSLGADYANYPSHVAKAVEVLRREGVDGPYGLALGPDDYTAVVETTEHGGYLLFDHLRRILGGPIVWAPGVDGAVVVSLRGGDFLFESGQDVSVGYAHHDAETISLYLEESFSFRVATPEAAIALVG